MGVPESYSMVYGGIDLGVWPYGLVVLKHPRPDQADIKSSRADYAAKDGGIVEGSHLAPLFPTLECEVRADGSAGLERQAELRHRLDALEHVLNPQLGSQFLYLKGDQVGANADRGAFGKVHGPINLHYKSGRTVARFQLNLVLEDGYYVGVTEVTEQTTLTASPQSFIAPLTTGSITGASNASPIVITSASHGLSTGMMVAVSGVGGNTAANGSFFIVRVLTPDTFELIGSTGNGAYTSGGTWSRLMPGSLYEKPTYLLFNDTGAAVTSLTLANQTTNETLNWTGSWANQDYLRINAELETIESSTDQIAWASEIGGLGSGDPFPRLKPRVSNSFQLTGLSAGTIDVVYRGRYL